MPDREMVIKGLECCMKDNCDNCPYYDPEVDHDCDYFGKCLRGNMYRDALALLKAQEPRVMTLEEVRDEAEHMYLEKHSKTGSDLYGCAIRGDWDGYGIELLMSEYETARERWSNYGKTWRCWTTKPTDEVKKVTPWE